MKERIKSSARKFKLEFKKSINTAIVAAFGFLMALVWKDVITGYVIKLEEISPLKGQLISAIIITIISVFGILMISKIFSESENKKV